MVCIGSNLYLIHFTVLDIDPENLCTCNLKIKRLQKYQITVGRNVCVISARTIFVLVIVNILMLLPSQHVPKYFIRSYVNSPDHFPASHEPLTLTFGIVPS